MKADDRYIGPPTVRQSYTKSFLVECPKCQSPAIVADHKLACKKCMHTEEAAALVRFNAAVNRNCDNCGKPIMVLVPNNLKKVKSLDVSCPHCEAKRTYVPVNTDYRLVYSNSEAGDPVFNLPLWFQSEIKGQLFWAYNREHLTEIRNYVAARLRERQTLTHTTMVERLPDFVKAAKNRATVLRTIDKLLRK